MPDHAQTATAPFIHPNAICESDNLGFGTRIWAFAHVLPGARIGADCNVCDGVFIENDVIIGDRVTLKCGVQLWDGLRLEDDVFVGPNATFTNDRFPRSRRHPDSFPVTTIQKGASIGANATILPGLTIGRDAMVGAGAVVTHNVPPRAVVIGNPARIVDYVHLERRPGTQTRAQPASAPEHPGPQPLRVPGCSLWRLRKYADMRGSLTPLDFATDLPFEPRRIFFVYNVPNERVRGEHAHRECAQFLMAVRGELSVVVDDGSTAEEVRLDAPDLGLLIPSGVWGIQYKFRPGSVLAVFASHPYEDADYVRDYDDFLAIRGS